MTVIEMSGNRFREIRKGLGLRQCDIAPLLGYSRQHICIVENEKRVPPVMALAILQIERMRADEAA